MDYLYEQLGPERFQHLCQALLVRENPNVQCLPVAQPDGGRDALMYLSRRPRDQAIVFQVKYARRPQTEQDPHKWLVDTLSGELPKIKRLADRGATGYYLLTNISGTAHADAGSIDLAQELLDNGITIDAHCWWRDDLNRRLDDAWDIKWSYPEILTGKDMVRAIAESGLTEDRERREAALRAFLRAQYTEDREVRFKQIELQNDLLDLFVDVPAALRRTGARLRSTHLDHALLSQIALETRAVIQDDADTGVVVESDGIWQSDYDAPGAATALLHPAFQKSLPYLVLEGAPGQGKSTLVQYVCQVHRMRILGEKHALGRVAEHHRSGGVFLPIKIELRDYATWLAKRDPFSSDPDEQPQTWQRSLESFISALVRHHSGGAEFSVSDIHAVFRISAVLLVLDALDEVPDIAAREEVVREVSAAIPRVQENAAALQVVVTSRPAAFANSPGFSAKLFRHAELTPLPSELVDEYANRWLAAKKLPKRESGEVRRLLQQRLAQSHLRDLSRNPMQLAILLSLVHSRGASLPDKRTALYDNYIELFFNREAEKSPIIREHRDLLIEIHQYLAWRLHTEAEEGGRGVISQEALKDVLRDYLSNEEHNVDLVDELFSGMVERVVALVSRVQGTYEFEVQPLREYFVARHLYETAPYSPVGGERTGTKPDRFDAISRNFYWLNVTRFYAGCYSKGELASLVERLDELASAEEFRYTSYPRSLAAMLLSDWVFTQEPRSMRQVVEIALNGLGLRHALDSTSNASSADRPFVLPERNGQDELVSKCIRLLKGFSRPMDYTNAVVRLLNANSPQSDRVAMWRKEAAEVPDDQMHRWLRIGQWMGVLPQFTTNEVEKYMKVGVSAKALLLDAGHSDVIHKNQEAVAALVDGVLDSRVFLTSQRRSSVSPLVGLAVAMHAPSYSLAFAYRGYQMTMADGLRRYGFIPNGLMTPGDYPTGLLSDCAEVFNTFEEEAQRGIDEWGLSIAPWDRIVEQARLTWGTRTRLIELAVVGAGIRSRDERFPDSSDLFDESDSLCQRVRYARLRAGNVGWWSATIERASTPQERLLASMVILAWGSGPTISSVAGQLGALLDDIKPSDFTALMRGVNRSGPFGEPLGPKELSQSDVRLPDDAPPRLVVVVGARAKRSFETALWERHLQGYAGRDPHVLEFAQRVAIPRLLYSKDEWKAGVALAEETYARGSVYPRGGPFLRGRGDDEVRLSLAAARAIVERADRLPYEVVALAEERCREDVAESVMPVLDVASRDGWWDR